MEATKTIWTIGHSTHSIEKLVAMLQSFNVQSVVDVRRYPGSRKYPQFNKEALEVLLAENSIHYVHIGNLGGRRKTSPDSKNTGWRHIAFRGYADYMETSGFKDGVEELLRSASAYRTAYMCSEALWWRCHRALISDYLKLHGWKVMHIMGSGKAEEHPYTKPSKIVNGALNYEMELKSD
jgi:uncharacterized protein (DUF488 family)